MAKRRQVFPLQPTQEGTDNPAFIPDSSGEDGRWARSSAKALNRGPNNKSNDDQRSNYGAVRTLSSHEKPASEEKFKGEAESAKQLGPVSLERKVGLVSGINLIVGTMIGSGIFVSPQGVMRHAGSVGLSLIVWAVCGVVSLLGALCYAEIGTIIPESGGEYSYLLQAFAPEIEENGNENKRKKNRGAFYQPLPAFLFSWVYNIMTLPTSLAIISLTFAQYFQRVFDINCSDFVTQSSADKLIAACAILLVAFVNVFSVTLATKVQNVFTVAKLVAMLIIIVGGFVMLGQGSTQNLATGFESTTDSPGQIALAFYSGFWAYSGWNNLNYAMEELKNPYVNLPRAIIIAIPLVTVAYLLVNISYLTVMTRGELLASDTVAVLFGTRVMGTAGGVVMVITVVLSTFGAANGSAFSGARVCYAAAREGHIVDILSFVHISKKTPSPGVIFNSLLALIFIIPSDISSLIDFFSFTNWMYFGLVMVALLVLRKTRPDAHRPVKVFIGLPIFMLLLSIFLVVAPIIDSPQVQYLYAIVFILVGVLVYIPFVHFQWVCPGMRSLTKLIQILLQAVPEDQMPKV